MKNTDETMRASGYVTASCVARATGRAKSTISQHCANGNVVHQRVGASLYVKWSSFVEWITKGDATIARKLGLNPERLPK